MIGQLESLILESQVPRCFSRSTALVVNETSSDRRWSQYFGFWVVAIQFEEGFEDPKTGHPVR